MISISSEAHGGSCCGMFHLFSFPVGPSMRFYDTTAKIASIKEAILAGKREFDHHGGTCVEVVLSAHQLHSWRAALEECGFTAVHTFINGNTSNELTVFLGDF